MIKTSGIKKLTTVCAIIIIHTYTHTYIFFFLFDIFSTVHHSIDLFRLPNLMHNSFIH